MSALAGGSGGKQAVEVLKIRLADVDAVQMPATVLIAPAEAKP